jgi:hypothetical protein
MLNVTAFILIVIWIVGLITAHSLGGGIHVLLVLGIVIFIYKTTRRPQHFELIPIKNNKQKSLLARYSEAADNDFKNLRR